MVKGLKSSSTENANNMRHNRRDFIKVGAVAAAGWCILPGWVFAGKSRPPFVDGYPVHNIPADKNIDPDWLKGLYRRGAPTTYRKSKNELLYLGMPAGGLHSGSLYLGGDGRLWLWEIYNDDREGIDSKTIKWFDGEKQRDIRNRDGANYVSPALAGTHRKLGQGFAIAIKSGDKTWMKRLDSASFDEIIFTATYPQATIEYVTMDLPLKIVMRAGAFYIPLRPDDSSLPATGISLEITNLGHLPMEISVIGWLENGVGKDTCLQEDDGVKKSSVFELDGKPGGGVFHTADLKNNEARDQGSMCLALLEQKSRCAVVVSKDKDAVDFNPQDFPEGPLKDKTAECTFGEKLYGVVSTLPETLHKDQVTRADYAISWHFNHSLEKLQGKMPESKDGYYYGKLFPDAKAVVDYISTHFQRLSNLTRLWQATYYDSSLPHWLLERSIINIGTIATANTYRFASGRFWGWEGVNACEGNCTHVWQYGHTLARLFPSIESDTRERVDLGLAQLPDGGIEFRGEFDTRPAIDGQAGTVLRIYREHQMSADSVFLEKNWKNIKRAIVFLLHQDKNGDGMTDTPMENTLDAVWEGEIAWIVGLCLAAVKAGQYMAREMQDTAFEKKCRLYVEKGIQAMESSLFNGEYFIHRPDAVSGRSKLGSYNTCHIDQVYGQSWAFQVGLGRLWDKDQTCSALRALWKYNFAPDVGPYIKTHIGGRPYALAGEAGMIMNTNPHNEPKPYGDNVTWQLGYFHECMSGFEHQVAAHMMAEGMTDESLILTRAIHDRYHAAKRNPYNEIECSDHYARAMASYGTYLNACGYYYHGPKGILGFAPKLQPADFKTAFTAAEGWGSYQQQIAAKGSETNFRAALSIKYGQLELKEFKVELPKALALKSNKLLKITVRLNKGRKAFTSGRTDGGDGLSLHFKEGVRLVQNDLLEIEVR